MKGRILVIGSSNTDMVIVSNKFPLPGETVLGGKFFMNSGGKGANQAVAAARLGGQVSFVSKVGKDVFGQQALLNLKNEGIDVSSVVFDPDNPSGVAQIIVDQDGENEIVVAPGANMNLTPANVDEAISLIFNADIILMQLEVPLETVIHVADVACKMGKKVILNPAPATTMPNNLFRSLSIITPNESETTFLTGIKISDMKSAGEAAKILHGKGVNAVIITLGAEGAYISTENLKQRIPAPHVKAVDTTAAGDTFNGALAVALSLGKSLEDSADFACHAASIAVTRMGAQSSIPSLMELEKFMGKST